MKACQKSEEKKNIISERIEENIFSFRNENEPLEKELSNLRERHNELLEHYNVLKNELIRIQNSLVIEKDRQI